MAKIQRSTGTSIILEKSIRPSYFSKGLLALVVVAISLIATFFYTKSQQPQYIINNPLADVQAQSGSSVADAPAEVLGANDENTSTTTKEKTNDITVNASDEGVKDESKEKTTEPVTPKVTSAAGQVFYGRGTPNNKFGMYVHNITDDVKAAAKLVNTNGGDWGWVLLTMDINDRNKDNWKGLLGAAKSAHLIPIIQIANNNVCKADKMDFEAIAKMLNGVNWPSKYLYISVFNEMNAKDYWCDRIAPGEYAEALNKAIKEFKAVNKNFFVMPGAFNSSARTQDRYLSEDSYLVQMNNTVPGIFKKIDGWATHSYPQPNFSGDPENLPAGYSARDTINNYTWEMTILKNNFGIGGLPIFITETGWLHREGQNGCFQYSQAGLLSADTTAQRFKAAFTNYWLSDPRIVAVTPFIFRSKDPCAMGFAWQKSDGSWYPQATMLIDIPKTAGSGN